MLVLRTARSDESDDKDPGAGCDFRFHRGWSVTVLHRSGRRSWFAGLLNEALRSIKAYLAQTILAP
jgi:hypothetical protein